MLLIFSLLNEDSKVLLDSMPKMKKDVYETYVKVHEGIPFDIDFARFEFHEGFRVLITRIYYRNGSTVYTCHTSNGYKISISNCPYDYFVDEMKDWLNSFK